MRIKEQETHLTLQEHHDDDDDETLKCGRQRFVKNAYPNSMKIRDTTSKTDRRTDERGLCTRHFFACHVTRRTFVQ